MRNALIIDNFAGGGGASLGMERALGCPVSIAVNHDQNAIIMHRANHPATRHYCEDVWSLDPLVACEGRPVDIAWFSPDCKDFSRAKGGKPVSRRVRGLAWLVLKWAGTVRPTLICLENVEEFMGWSRLTRSGRRSKKREGETFRKFVAQWRALGYAVEWRKLKACDYGTPTIRERLFMIARCDGLPIVWPEPTHGEPGNARGLAPYRTAAECIDFSIPCPSIFLTRDEAKAWTRATGTRINRPLAGNTMTRIARGLKKFVLDAPEPFIVPVTHNGDSRIHSISEPFRTITTANRGELALVQPFISRQFGNSIGSPIGEPIGAVTAGGGGKTALVVPFLTKYHGIKSPTDVRGGHPDEPFKTLDTQNRFGLVAAFMEQANTGLIGHPATRPLSTITQAGCQQRLIAVCLNHQYGSNTNGGQGDIRRPMKTVTTGGHHAMVYAFMIKYFGAGGQWQGLDGPLHVGGTKPRFGLVTVDIAGIPYVVVDIGMRMLRARELFNAQGFPGSYDIECIHDGKALTKTAQVEKCGNSVAPQVVEAIIAANAPGAQAIAGRAVA